MADEFDPTEITDKTPLTPGDDGDDDDVDDFSNIDINQPVSEEELQSLLSKDTDTTQPFKPGASSTPYQPGAAYHPGEEHELTNLSQEQSGLAQGPGEAAWNALTLFYPDASAVDLEAFMDPKTNRLMVRKAGAGKASYPLYTTERVTGRQRLNPKLPLEIRNSLGESRADQTNSLQQERDINRKTLQAKEQTLRQMEESAALMHQLKQEMDAIREQIRQIDDQIRELEDRHGPLDVAAIQRMKDEKRALEAEHQAKRNQYDKAYADAKEMAQLQIDINNLELEKRNLDEQINKLGIVPEKQLQEKHQEKADIEKKVAEGRRVLADKNASASDKEAARQQVEEGERDLGRIDEDIEGEEERLPLRERIREIFKKYGWPLQAIVLAAGITISAVVLATLKGLAKATKAIGNGLKELGKKAANALPGLIGSIVSFIFKTAGSVISFLGEHAWLLILAVVAYMVERVTKRARS